MRFTAAVVFADRGGRREIRPRHSAELLDQRAEVTWPVHGVTGRRATAS